MNDSVTQMAGAGPDLKRTRNRKAPMADGKGIDRLPPHSPEAERAVLGCILYSPEGAAAAMDACLERWGKRREVFYELPNQVIYDAILGLYEAGSGVDMITVQQRLKDLNMLAEVGGIEYLARLPDAVPSSLNIGYYLGTVWDKFLLRQTLAACVEAAGRIYETESDAGRVLDQVTQDLLRLGETAVGQREEKMREAILRVMADMEEHYVRGRAQLRGLSTGLEYVDKLLCGIGGKHGNYVVISARPGFGKTSLAMQIACHVALDHEWSEPLWQELVDGKWQMTHGKPTSGRERRPLVEQFEDGTERRVVEKKRGLPVAIFSLEMATEALVERMVFERARGDMQRWRTGFATNADLDALVGHAVKLGKAPIWIDDEPRCTIDTLRAKARRMFRQYGIKLFIIDYIQLLRAGGKRFRDDRVQELSEISGEIQALGKELQVPFIVLAQMNRDFEKDPNRKPRLSDLKDCGSIEQDADVVGFLYKPKLRDKAEEVYDRAMEAEYGQDWSQRPGRVDLLVAKNRYGPTGHCELLFQRSCTRFLDYVRWLKEHGEATPSLGDRGLPSNDELGIEE